MIWISLVFSSLDISNKIGNCICFEPIKALDKTFYYCDKKFHIDEIVEIYKSEYLSQIYNINIKYDYGVVFISGDGYSIYQITKSSNHYNYNKIYNETVTLAKKHNKGGQSALRFSRLQEESEQNYITKVSEKVVEVYKKINIDKICVVGNANKKNLLEKSELIQSNFTKIFIETIDSINLQSINNFLSFDIKKILFDYENQLQIKLVNKLNNLIELKPELLYFGLDEITKNTDKISEIYYQDTIDIMNLNFNKKIKLYQLDKNNMDVIGVNCIGIKYYSNDNDYYDN